MRENMRKRNIGNNEPTVFNLSSKKLTRHQEKVLNYGLKFIPTNLNIDLTELITDLKEWERQMRLAEYFADKDD